jgi:hypothetical protein
LSPCLGFAGFNISHYTVPDGGLLRKLAEIVIFSLLFILPRLTHGQQIDAAFGVGTVTAPSASSASGDHSPQSLGGGTFLSFSGDFVFKNNVGFQAEVAWRASQNLYQEFQPYRPILYDFNLLYARQFGKVVQAELLAGGGGESIRFYQPFTSCSAFSCSNFVSSNHLLGHIGGALRFYVMRSIFVAPEAHAYFIHNNVEFSSSHAQRYGVKIGYTFAPRD